MSHPYNKYGFYTTSYNRVNDSAETERVSTFSDNTVESP